MKVAIIGPPFDVPGLKHSLKILKKVLKNILEIKYQCGVEFFVLQGDRALFDESVLKPKTLSIPKEFGPQFFDVGFFIEALYSNKELYDLSKKNIWIPHQEYVLNFYREPQKYLDDTWCLTRETGDCLRRVFFTESPLTFSGWTSISRKAAIDKDFKKILHLAGNSLNKGTVEILKVWGENPDLPELQLITRNPNNQLQFRPEGFPPNVKVHHLPPNKKVTELLNECGVHLCTSTTEGFGHYINEGLSTGAITLTTDGGPMNEFYGPKVKVAETTHHNYAFCHKICCDSLLDEVNKVLNLSRDEALTLSYRSTQDFWERHFNFIEFVMGYDFLN